MLGNLGIENTALGFIAGFTGNEIVRRLGLMGVTTDFIRIDSGDSRINLKLRSIEGTEINGRGPDINADAVRQLMEKLDATDSGDILVLAGSIPSSIPDDIYKKILDRLSGRDIHTVVDATGDLLVNVLFHHPFLVKPNNHELGEIFGVKLRTRDGIVPYAEKLRKMGARNVLVSMAGEGAVLAAENGNVYTAPAPEGTLVNGVGAGDSMVAGFLAGWMEKQDYLHAFRMGLSAGSASAFSEYLASRPEIEAVYRQLVFLEDAEKQE